MLPDDARDSFLTPCCILQVQKLSGCIQNSESWVTDFKYSGGGKHLHKAEQPLYNATSISTKYKHLLQRVVNQNQRFTYKHYIDTHWQYKENNAMNRMISQWTWGISSRHYANQRLRSSWLISSDINVHDAGPWIHNNCKRNVHNPQHQPLTWKATYKIVNLPSPLIPSVEMYRACGLYVG